MKHYRKWLRGTDGAHIVVSGGVGSEFANIVIHDGVEGAAHLWAMREKNLKKLRRALDYALGLVEKGKRQ